MPNPSPVILRGFPAPVTHLKDLTYSTPTGSPLLADLHDVIAAIIWLRATSQTYNLDPQRIGLWGASAGAHLAALAALSAPETNIKAVPAAYPPTDFLQMPRSPQNYQSRFPGAPVETVPDLVKQANPATRAHPGAPPFLLLHGLSDTEVPPQPERTPLRSAPGTGRRSNAFAGRRPATQLPG